MRQKPMVKHDMGIGPLLINFGGSTPAVAGLLTVMVVSLVLDYYYRVALR